MGGHWTTAAAAAAAAAAGVAYADPAWTAEVLHAIAPAILAVACAVLLVQWRGSSSPPADQVAAVEEAHKGYHEERVKKFPPSFANGWYLACRSEELPVGGVKELKLLGQTLAVYRGEDGVARVMDAFCPHLGANMAVGGTVEGDSLRCPFHGWEFEGKSGACTRIPYASRIPSLAKTRAYPVREYANTIVFFYHHEAAEPTYDPIPLPEIDTNKLQYRGRTKGKIVRMCLEDFATNASDYTHFDVLHGIMSLPGGKHYTEVQHNVVWSCGKEAGKPHHLSWFNDTVKASIKLPFGRKFTLPDFLEAQITFDGPGGIVHFRFVTTLGDILLLKHFQPIDTMTHMVNDIWYADPNIPRLLVKFVINEALFAFDADIFVWENKTYSNRPVIIKEDGPVMKTRRWFQQFLPPTRIGTDAKADSAKANAAAADAAPAKKPTNVNDW